MNTGKKQRKFSMKYCPDLDDHVVVMTATQGGVQNQVCLSSHLCHTDTRMSCGHERSVMGKKDETVIF